MGVMSVEDVPVMVNNMADIVNDYFRTKLRRCLVKCKSTTVASMLVHILYHF